MYLLAEPPFVLFQQGPINLSFKDNKYVIDPVCSHTLQIH